MKFNEIPKQFDPPISATIRSELHENAAAVVRLLKKAGVSLAEWLALDSVIRAELYQNTDAVVRLLQEGVVRSLAELLALDSAIRAELYQNTNAVIRLLQEGVVRSRNLPAALRNF